MKKAGKIRLGIIGAGKMASWHSAAYHRIPGVEMVAIANPNSDRGKKLAKKYSIPKHFSNGFDLIQQAEIDAVDISVPTGLHKDLILRALDRGIHIYAEKPLCPAVLEIEEVIRKNEKAKKVIFNGFNYRFLPEFIQIKEIIKSGQLGRIRYIRMFRTTKENPNSYIFSPQGNGIFKEFQCHFIDLLYDFGFPDPLKVFANGNTVLNWELDPDTATTTLWYPENLIAEITTSFASPGITPEIFIIGTVGTLKMRFGRISVTGQKEKWNLSELIRLMFIDSLDLPFRIFKNPFDGSCRYFVSCIREGLENGCDEKGALRALKIASLAEESYKRKLPIEIN